MDLPRQTDSDSRNQQRIWLSPICWTQRMGRNMWGCLSPMIMTILFILTVWVCSHWLKRLHPLWKQTSYQVSWPLEFILPTEKHYMFDMGSKSTSVCYLTHQVDTHGGAPLVHIVQYWQFIYTHSLSLLPLTVLSNWSSFRFLLKSALLRIPRTSTHSGKELTLAASSGELASKGSKQSTDGAGRKKALHRLPCACVWVRKGGRGILECDKLTWPIKTLSVAQTPPPPKILHLQHTKGPEVILTSSLLP